MDSLELIQLGRQLTRIGEESLRGSNRPALPNGPSLVLKDVFANRDSSITDIATRTGLPQSYVSDSVASLQREGFVKTRADNKDRRRTLVRVTSQHRRTVASKGAAPIDAALSKALGDAEADQVSVTLELLQMLAERLRPERPGPILAQIQQREGSPSSA